ncbi:MAG: hypothetical protein JSV91_15855 [Phycisphaerales bacterium]|nr:MAG: hypothetical protein JSV91_15855 [Phycisphaerales bacterium]
MKTIARFAALTAAFAVLVGCQGGGEAEDVSYSAIIGDLTPELRGLSERPIDMDRNIWVTANQNQRMMWGDLSRALYIDHPSTLSPYPIELTSGQPR